MIRALLLVALIEVAAVVGIIWTALVREEPSR